MKRGSVSLVGAGPGDPGLITIAGLERIREADVIVYDRLVGPGLLEEARPDAELIYMGKVAGECAHDQDAINRLLIEKARDGKRVLRLKGGDPFVFGRGGEEAQALREAGVPFEVVPGVTSAIAVPAYAGIPVTHRGLASSFAVITGHEADPPVILSADATASANKQSPRRNLEGGDISTEVSETVRWEHLATGVDTLVFLMGTKTLPEIVEKLVAHGRPARTPAAVIRWGTTAEQRTVVGTLGDIVQRVEEARLAPPAITVVGEVVRLRETLRWFGQAGDGAVGGPLSGKRVLITRTRRQASKLARLLAEEGAIPVELPAIEIEPAADSDALDAAVRDLGARAYAWAGFTSANAVELFFHLLAERGLDARAFGGAKLFAIGPATAQALLERGIRADVVPGEYVAEALAEALASHVQPGERVLLPRAEGARPELADALTRLGASVDDITLYRAAVPRVAPEEALALLRAGAIDIVTFTSSSTVRNLAALLNGDLPVILSGEKAGVAPSRRNLVVEGRVKTPVRGRRPLVAGIGPVTAKAAEELGLRVDIVASEYTVEGLVEALREQIGGGG